jgi:hypothetical protein
MFLRVKINNHRCNSAELGRKALQWRMVRRGLLGGAMESREGTL